MSAVTFNFEHSDGDSKTIAAAVSDAAGDALDLTGATAIWKAKPLSGQAPPVNLNNGSGITYTDAAAGLLAIFVPPGVLVTDDGEITRWNHSLRIEKDADSQTVLRGIITVTSAPAAPS